MKSLPEKSITETQTAVLEVRNAISSQVARRQCSGRGGRRFKPCVGKIPWRRKWQPTPVFLPGKFHGQRSLAGYSLWGCKDLDMKSYDQPRQHIKQQRHYLVNKGPSGQGYGVSSGHVWM